MSTIFFLAACSGSKPNNSTKNGNTEISMEEGVITQAGHSDIEPGMCRLIGKIVDIKPTTKTNTKKKSCSAQPCVATVKIIQTLGCGMGVSQVISPERIYEMHFAFTLGKTQKLFPELNRPLPGLKKGEKFQADVSVGESMNGVACTVYSYVKK